MMDDEAPLVLVLLLLLLRIIDDGDNDGGDHASIFVLCDGWDVRISNSK